MCKNITFLSPTAKYTVIVKQILILFNNVNNLSMPLSEQLRDTVQANVMENCASNEGSA